MPQTLSCPQGHRWERPDGDADQPALCPVCGAAGAAVADTPTSGPDAPVNQAQTPTLAHPAGDAAPPPIGGYEFVAELGRGGMGVVYKARQPHLDRFVAVKVLSADLGRDPAFAERFTREARALARLSHPNILTVFDFGQADGQPYFVMEYVDGGSLRQRLRAGPLALPEIVAIVLQVCDALQYAHEEGVVHRDVKPENALLDRKGRVKIADFGIAKLLTRKTGEYTLTGPAQVMGTLHYMAPEQIDNPQALDHRADIYALGVMLYEMLTGRLPLGRFAPPSAKTGVDARLDGVVLRALEPDPAARYPQAADLRAALQALGVRAATPPGTAVTPPRPGVPTAPTALLTATAEPGPSQARALERLRLPAGAMILAGLLSLVPAVAAWVHVAGQGSQNVSAPVMVYTEYQTLASLIVGNLLIWGGVEMRRGRAYRLALIASFVALLPCPVGCCLTFPVGLWGVMTLQNAEVRAAFAARTTR